MKKITLKKSFAFVALMLLGGTSSAWADETTVGNTDCSSDAWAANQYYALQYNQTLHVEFVNHNEGSGYNWFNFLIRFTDDQVPTNTYACYRADNYGWGTCYDGGLCYSNWDWENFMTNLNGATVKLDVIREDNIVKVDANVTTTASLSFNQTYYADLGTTEDIYVGLSCEKSYIVIDNSKTTTTTTSYTNEGAWSWSNDLSSATGGISVQGSGTFESGDPFFGTVYQNVGIAQRTNYLMLPSDLFTHSKYTQKMTIGFWVNANNAAGDSYNWTPILSAYADAPTGSNTFPMFVAQYRGLLQVNNSGWCDYVAAQNTNLANAEYNQVSGNNWLADNQWHYYTVVLDGNNAKVYFDGLLRNEWNANTAYDSNDRCTQRGLFFFGGNLGYVCLGGNQAWAWGDNDSPFRFAKFYACNGALTADEIAAKMAEDMSVSVTLGANGYTTFANGHILNLAKLPAGLKAYKAEVDGSKAKVNFTEVNVAVPANTGLLLEGTPGATYAIPFTASASALTGNDFLVNEAGTTFDASGYTCYAMIKDSDPLSFGQFNPSTLAIPANKAYLKVANTSARELTVSFGDATGIADVRGKMADVRGDFFDLQGRRVAHPAKGLYITNGKKVVMK